MDNMKYLYHTIPGRENADLEFEQNVMNNSEALNQYKNDLNTYIDNEVQRINNGYIPRYDSNSYRIVPFSFKGFNFRSIIFDNDPNGNVWFINKEICNYLGHTNPSQAIRDAGLLDYERSSLSITEGTSPLGGNPNMTIISESGLYKLIGNSRKPEAREFQDWIYGNVIPSIRRTGAYIKPDLQQRLMSDPSYIRTIIAQNAQIKAENEALNAINKANSKYIDFAKAAIADGTCVSVNIFCKIMQNSLPFKFGEYMVFENLRCDGFLCRDKQNYNMPTAKAIQMELFKLAYDIDSHSYNLMVTPTGISYLIAFYKNKFNIQRNI